MQYLKNARFQLVEIVAIIDKALAAGKLPPIERDLLLAKLAEIYEGILLEKGNSEIKSEEKPQRNAEGKDAAPKTNITVKEVVPPKSIQAKGGTLSEKVEPSITEPKSANVGAKPNPATVTKSSNTSQNQEDNLAILADKFKGKHKFRNEVIAEQHQKIDMQSKLQNKPITDLSKAIGINDKFLFTKELFGGDPDLYNQTIKRLNHATDLNDAIIYIHENFDWEADNETAMTFIDLVRRKFS